ncbi:sterile alpha motif domain containing 1a isoform X2 [Mugil cephalus]|uniref:sterile alpha motif domain containing 1a isoform X2 n=1 Tax=Mugil cephalus TaxID=48193 RepID=UPI001FB5A54C|nr:sterile alpha motif domain containing 1a isoform X2 [Mugil cephalus]
MGEYHRSGDAALLTGAGRALVRSLSLSCSAHCWISWTRSRTGGNFSLVAPSTQNNPTKRMSTLAQTSCAQEVNGAFRCLNGIGGTLVTAGLAVCLRSERCTAERQGRRHSEAIIYHHSSQIAKSADTSMAMDTDSNADEEGADESRDGQDSRPSPGRTNEDATAHCDPVRAVSAPCSPSGSPSGTPPGPGLDCSPSSGLDCASLQRAGERPNSLPPSSPRALTHNNWAYDPALCPVERQHPGMQKDKVTTKPPTHFGTTSPCAPNNVKKEERGKEEDSSLSSDQLVPDYAARLDETRNVSDGKSHTLSLSSDNCAFKKMDISSFTASDDSLLNGGKGDDVSVKKEKMNQNLLQWTVADVASYFSAAGFPEQAVAFRTQEIDGKSLLLMQRSDVLTGLSIRLGPALKIYERHVKVLQRTHFLEYEDL